MIISLPKNLGFFRFCNVASELDTLEYNVNHIFRVLMFDLQKLCMERMSTTTKDSTWLQHGTPN